MRTTRSCALCGGGLVYSVVVGVAFALPLLLMLYYEGDFLPVANESLAYRFFVCERIQHGEWWSIWLPQGYLTSLIQHAIVAGIDRSLPLSARLNLFAQLSLAIDALILLSIVVVAGQSRSLQWLDRALIGLVALLPIYGTRTAGFYYSLLPDYYHLDLVLVTLGLLLFLIGWRRGRSDTTWVVVVGAYLGLLAANKISLVTLGGIVALPAFLNGHRSPRELTNKGATLLATAIATTALVFCGFYLFRIRAVARMLPKYVDFMLEAGGETQFWSSGTLFFLGYGCAYFIVFWIVASIVAAVVVGRLTDRRSTARLVVSASVILGVTQFYALYRRPAGTTAFETASLLLAFAAIALACVSERRVASWFIVASLAVWSVCCGWTFSWEANTRLVAESAPTARALWKLHEEILELARGRPIVVIIPDNSFSHGGVHELLLKAAADFPTWTISSRGQWLIKRYGPGLTFRHEHGGASPEDDIAQDAVVVWYDRPDKLPLKQRYRSITVASERVGTVTRDWMLQMSGVTQAVAHASFAP